MMKGISTWIEKLWKPLLAVALAATLFGAGCGGGAGGSGAAPTSTGDAITVEIPMVVPTSLDVGSALVTGSSSISSPMTKSLMAALSPSTYLSINGMQDYVADLLDQFVNEGLAGVFEDSGVPIRLTSSTSKHSATIHKSDGSTLYIDYKAFTYTGLTTTDPVSINPELKVCSGNSASPTTATGAICLRAWLVPPGLDPSDSTEDYRFMEAVFTVKPTELTKGAGAFHTITYYQTYPLLAGYTYNKDGTADQIFANVEGKIPDQENPTTTMSLLGDRFYSSGTTDSTGVLRFLNMSTFQPDRADLTTVYYYSNGTYLRENLKDTNVIVGGHSEYVVSNVCVNKTTGVEDLTGASCNALPSITAGFYGPAAPSDYTFQADFFKQPPSGFDPSN